MCWQPWDYYQKWKLSNSKNLLKDDSIPVWCVSTKFLLIYISRKKLYVSSSTLNILFKFHWILDNKSSIPVVKFRKFCWYCKMLCIFSSLDTCKSNESLNNNIYLWYNFQSLLHKSFIANFSNQPLALTHKVANYSALSQTIYNRRKRSLKMRLFLCNHIV